MSLKTFVITGSLLTLIAVMVKDNVVPMLTPPDSTYLSFACDVALAVVPLLVAYGFIPALRRLGIKFGWSA